MCEYCRNMKNSDDVESVVLVETRIGEINGKEVSVSLEMDCYEYGENGLYEISAVLNSEMFCLDALACLKINYCPMCGRKLGNGHK